MKLRYCLFPESITFTLRFHQKSNLRYTRIIPFRVSRVSGAHVRGFAPRPTQSGFNGGESLQRVGDLIGSGFEPHTSRTRSECHPV